MWRCVFCKERRVYECMARVYECMAGRASSVRVWLKDQILYACASFSIYIRRHVFLLHTRACTLRHIHAPAPAHTCTLLSKHNTHAIKHIAPKLQTHTHAHTHTYTHIHTHIQTHISVHT